MPPPDVHAGVEATRLAELRTRVDGAEFEDPQRLDFDLLLRVDRGTTTHAVDFSRHQLAPGDVLWIRSGAVHQWGEVGAIEGDVVLFLPSVVTARTRELIKAAGTCAYSHWPGVAGDGSAVGAAFAHLARCAGMPDGPVTGLREALATRALDLVLLHLAEATPRGGDPQRPPSQEQYIWFRDELDLSFRTMHKVREYADRLGYSTRTLNRIARANSGLTAKQLIDERIVLEAKRMLTHGDGTVAEIADHLGFADTSNFAAFFRTCTGVSPGGFRSQVHPEAALPVRSILPGPHGCRPDRSYGVRL